MNLKIQSKFFLTYLMLAVFPLSIFGIFAYIIAVNTMEDKAQDSYRVIAGQINYNVDAVLRGIDRMTILPFIDQRIYSAMTQLQLTAENYTDESFQIEKDLEKNITTYFTSLQVLHEGIIAVYMITDTDKVYGYSLLSHINPYNTLKEQAWFQETIRRDGGLVNSGLRDETQIYNTGGKKMISLARYVKQVDSSKPLGVFVVNIDPYIFHFSAQIPKEGNVVIADQYGNILYSSLAVNKTQWTEMMEMGKTLGPNRRSIQWDASSEKMVGVASTSQYSGWTTAYLTPEKALYQDLNRIGKVAIGIIAALLFLSIVIAGFVARGVASPIKRLSRLMKKVQSGEFYTVTNMKQRDEIGLLSNSFNTMVVELTRLIERIKSEENSKRKAEIDALRAQINPHFIYNTLSAIKMMAILQNANEIARVLDIFIQLMKYCTRSDRKWVTLKDEIEFIKDYVALLERRYMKQFSVTYTVESGADRVRIIPFLLQPIVENAIFHGLDSEKGGERIEITMRPGEAGDLVIRVQDYGHGMSEEKVRSLLDSGNERGQRLSGTGLRNIHERIGLEFGSPYGLAVDSVIGEGTVVTIRVPWEMEKEEL